MSNLFEDPHFDSNELSADEDSEFIATFGLRTDLRHLEQGMTMEGILDNKRKVRGAIRAAKIRAEEVDRPFLEAHGAETEEELSDDVREELKNRQYEWFQENRALIYGEDEGATDE